MRMKWELEAFYGVEPGCCSVLLVGLRGGLYDYPRGIDIGAQLMLEPRMRARL